ncbi:hypothetical protein QBC35DRAFT_105251 [Podospora australis]|uniref:Uncharacterized protein n=1 Tax=Podospora australis TaxID=1536484 RepID=A0AAN6X8S5_9PEZI|nr:hypothetical protein QBC35DRAFT_105251 [Podospora australis]
MKAASKKPRLMRRTERNGTSTTPPSCCSQAVSDGSDSSEVAAGECGEWLARLDLECRAAGQGRKGLKAGSLPGPGVLQVTVAASPTQSLLSMRATMHECWGKCPRDSNRAAALRFCHHFNAGFLATNNNSERTFRVGRSDVQNGSSVASQFGADCSRNTGSGQFGLSPVSPRISSIRVRLQHQSVSPPRHGLIQNGSLL